MNLPSILQSSFRFFIISLCVSATLRETTNAAEQRPNIVWILVDDMSCHFAYRANRW